MTDKRVLAIKLVIAVWLLTTGCHAKAEVRYVPPRGDALLLDQARDLICEDPWAGLRRLDMHLFLFPSQNIEARRALRVLMLWRVGRYEDAQNVADLLMKSVYIEILPVALRVRVRDVRQGAAPVENVRICPMEK